VYGDGERAAINLALERKFLLLIDDWRPYEAVQAAGIEVVNSLAYLIGLYEQNRITWEAQTALMEMIETGAVEILPLGVDDVPRMRELMRKYRDLPMDLPDAALVRVSERERVCRIFTLDRRIFRYIDPRELADLWCFRPGKPAGTQELHNRVLVRRKSRRVTT
jgi:predicted nucleic acid-binding protein